MAPRRQPPTLPAVLDRSVGEHRGTLASIVWRAKDGDFTIARLRDAETVKGILREPAIGLEYHFLGTWKHDGRYGWAFAFSDARPLTPTSTQGIRDYLLHHAPWVGGSVVREILTRYGADALRVLKEDPARVASEVRGITLERAGDIQQKLRELAALEAIEVDVRGIVGPAGVNSRQVRSILEEYGSEAAQVVRADPYRLIDDVDGVGWATADRIGQAVGVAPVAPGRLRAAIIHTLRQAEDEGNVCAPIADLIVRASALCSVDVADGEVSARVDELVRAGELAEYIPPGASDCVVYRRELYDAESTVASVVLRMLAGPGHVDDPLAWFPGPDEIEAEAEVA